MSPSPFLARGSLVALLFVFACTPPPENADLHWNPDTVGPGPEDDSGGELGTGGMAGAPIGGEGPAVGGDGGAAAGAGGQAGAGAQAPPPPPPPKDAGVSPEPKPVMDAGAMPPPAGMKTCSLTITVTTVTTNRNYRPKNIGAIWIADKQNKFVKSAKVWAARRIQHLAKWSNITGAAGMARNTTDAVTGATLNSHIAHTAKWNCTDAKTRMPVARGDYSVCFEMTESNTSQAPSQFQCVPFTIGEQPFTMMLADHKNFIKRTLTYVP